MAHKDMKQLVLDKSTFRFGFDTALKRFELARKLRAGRRSDRRQQWGVSFDASLETVSKKFYHLNLLKEIKQHRTQSNPMRGASPYTVLDLGGGSGKLASELVAKLGPKTRVMLSGVTRNAAWGRQPNANQLQTVITHAEQLSKRLAPSSIDFINASFSLSHATDLNKALKECKIVLRKGGRVIFNQTGSGVIQSAPSGFKFIFPPKRVIIRREFSEITSQVVYLEKA